MELEQIGKKLKVFASVAAKKTGDAVEITKHSINKAGLEKEIDDLYKQIGQYVYSQTVSGSEYAPQIMEGCKKINSLLFEIESLNMEIDAIKYPNYSAHVGTAATETAVQSADEQSADEQPAAEAQPEPQQAEQQESNQ